MRQLGELATMINARVRGDVDVQIADAASIHRASRDNITLVAAEKHLACFLGSDAPAAVIAAAIDLDAHPAAAAKTFLAVDDAEASFVRIVQLFRPPIVRRRIGISNHASISESAEIAEDVDIHPGAVIGDRVRIGCGSIIHAGVSILHNVTIGTHTTIFPNAVIYENCIIGDRCTIHGGAVIGAYGFGYRSGTSHELAAQLGNVVVGNDVEIGANSTIDRGTYDSTTIGNGTKIDNQVMIGHNCQIGQHNLFCAQVGIAGSCITGDYVVMAGQVGVGDHLRIGDRAILAAKSGVMHDLPGDQVYLGSPAIPVREQLQLHALISKLPQMRSQIRRLQQSIESASVPGMVRQDAA